MTQMESLLVVSGWEGESGNSEEEEEGRKKVLDTRGEIELSMQNRQEMEKNGKEEGTMGSTGRIREVPSPCQAWRRGNGKKISIYTKLNRFNSES